MTFTTLLHIVNLFITTGSDLPSAINKFGPTESTERNNVHLKPKPEWDAQSIVLEMAEDKTTVSGVVLTLDRARAVLPKALEDEWGKPTQMPRSNIRSLKTIRYDFKFDGGTGLALVNYDGDLARNEMQIHRIIMRRFPSKP